MQAHADGARREAELVRELRGGGAALEPGLEDDAVEVGELTEAPAQCGTQLQVAGDLGGVGLPAALGQAVRFEGARLPGVPAARLVDQDPREPGVERTLLVPAGRPLERRQEGLLDQVLGAVARPHQVPRQPEQGRGGLVEDPVEGLVVPPVPEPQELASQSAVTHHPFFQPQRRPLPKTKNAPRGRGPRGARVGEAGAATGARACPSTRRPCGGRRGRAARGGGCGC